MTSTPERSIVEARPSRDALRRLRPRPTVSDRCIAGCTALLCLVLASCGKRGDPLPPVRPVPQAVTDVTVTQSGSTLRVSYTVPRAMSDGSRPGVMEIEMLRSETAGDFEKTARKSVKKAAPGEVLSEEFPLPPSKTRVRVALRARASGKASPLSTVVSFVVRDVVAAPSGLSAVAAARGARLEWSPVAPPPTQPGTASVVRPAPPSPSPTPPPTPAPTAAAVPSPNPSPPPVTYRIFRRPDAGSYGRALTPAPIPAASHDDVDAPTEARSCYVVRAVVSTEPLVESADSNEACVTLEDTQAPAAPTGFVAFVRENTIELFWDASPEADLAEYRIYRFPPETEPKLLLEVDAGVTRHVDTTATPGAVYFYHVRAVDKAGNESPPSGQAQGGIQ